MCIILGTSSIVDEVTHEPILSILSLIVETAVKLRKDGHKVIIVSSGAVGVGLRRMDVDQRPKYLPRLQVSEKNAYRTAIMLTALIGPFCCRAMPLNVVMGLTVQPSSTTSRPNPDHSKRYSRQDTIYQCAEYTFRTPFDGSDTNSQ